MQSKRQRLTAEPKKLSIINKGERGKQGLSDVVKLRIRCVVGISHRLSTTFDGRLVWNDKSNGGCEFMKGLF